MIRALFLRLRYRMAMRELDWMMTARESAERQVIELTRKAADAQRACLLQAEPVLARKASGEIIYHNFRRAPQLRVVGGKDAA